MIRPFHLRDQKIGHPHDVSVGEWLLIAVRHTIVLLRVSVETSHGDEILLLELSRLIFLGSCRLCEGIFDSAVMETAHPWRRLCNFEAVVRCGVAC